ncbi:hypothetical protein [Enhygromyxa salina]|uniref:Integral membrane protein n=1 Tax=Enhygromyxa salina TaxID=215803 RepID=A0A2S9YIH8_9BACT|nr:hypothetical protein [Enhygromyxa salina]PRQ04917.1 hypothetical protein ENSA7_48480 [Enhygromyxa salina]
MQLPEKFALCSAMIFFLVGLISGVWKYAKIRGSTDASAPVYVDICHRASLLYAFACLLLERMVEVGTLPVVVELAALAALIGFFAFAVFGYALHGWLADTDNQLRRPHVLGRRTLAPGFVHASMIALVGAELGGFVVLCVGVWQAW